MKKHASEWSEITILTPPDGKIVRTAIIDGEGIRNDQDLLRGPGNLWFFPDGSMHVYYTPTHWRYTED